MIARRFTNTDVIAHLQNFSNLPEFKIKHGNELVRGLSFIPLSAASKYRKYSNYHDLLQCGYETLWRSIISFDTSKSQNFFGWAFLWIRQKIAKEALKEKIYLNTYVLSGLATPDEEDDNDLENLLLESEEKHIINEAMRQLDKSHRDILLQVYNDERSLRDLGHDIKMSHESVRKIRDDATRILKRIIDQKLIINT